MIILGLNYYYHDSSACLVADGKLVAALEEERFTRRKHTYEFPRNAIARCLDIAGVHGSDVDYIAVSIKPELHWPKKMAYGFAHIGNAKSFARHELWRGWNRQREFWDWYRAMWPKRDAGPQVVFVPHHLSHAAGSFYVSPYESAAILSLDGSGEWATSFIGAGRGSAIESFSESFFPHSLGSFYEAATEFCGFKVNYDEGKTMGLAPLGDASVFEPIVRDIIDVSPDSQIKIDLSYFSYQHWGHRRCSPKFHQVFGQPRDPKAPFERHHENVAAAFQRVLEDKVLMICKQLHARCKEKYLVIAGGVSLNSVMNGRILRETPFEDVYVMPAAGDNGTAIGAAYFVYNGLLKRPREFEHDDPYLGTAYTDQQIKRVIEEAKLPYTYCEDIADVAAKKLREGHIIGWFQNRMEIGPRSLGNRSILADPTDPRMKDKINAEVKHREAFRPFAPSGTVESRSEFFDISVETPFMLKVCDVRPDKRALLPAITHVDGSARLQTVRKDINPLYHRLISRFGELSGVPVVLNTSFNIMGEPIVESPINALRCFYSTGLDLLCIGNFLLSKR